MGVGLLGTWSEVCRPGQAHHTIAPIASSLSWPNLFNIRRDITHTLHVCHICLHWGGLGGQCRHIWHTWSVWVSWPDPKRWIFLAGLGVWGTPARSLAIIPHPSPARTPFHPSPALPGRFTLPGTNMEVENHLFVVENGLPNLGPFSTSTLWSSRECRADLPGGCMISCAFCWFSFRTASSASSAFPSVASFLSPSWCAAGQLGERWKHFGLRT